MEVILASGSPRRRELLTLAGVEYTVRPADVEEVVPEGMPAPEQSEYLALLKAEAAAKLYPEAIVIGADTTVIDGDTVLGKPKDAADAAAMLRELSGRTHQVVTGVALVKGSKKVHFSSVTDVTFYPLTEEEIAAYVATGEPLDKAGAYGVQGKGFFLVRELRGDYYTVVGLPLAETVRKLREMGAKVGPE